MRAVATILERSEEDTIQDWFALVQCESSLMQVPLSHKLRCGHLHHIFGDLVLRLGRIVLLKQGNCVYRGNSAREEPSKTGLYCRDDGSRIETCKSASLTRLQKNFSQHRF